MTVTVITLLKRRPGLGMEAFRAYYEDHHRRIGEQVLGGYATRYVRRYLAPTDGVDADFDFDVITEVDFPDEVARDACFAAMADPEVMAMIVEDEAKLFDRDRIRSFSVSESGSDLPPLP